MLEKARCESLFDIANIEEFLTADQLAKRLNISVKTIRKWRYENRLPPETMVKIGRKAVRYKWSSIFRWLSHEEK